MHFEEARIVRAGRQRLSLFECLLQGEGILEKRLSLLKVLLAWKARGTGESFKLSKEVHWGEVPAEAGRDFGLIKGLQLFRGVLNLSGSNAVSPELVLTRIAEVVCIWIAYL